MSAMGRVEEARPEAAPQALPTAQNCRSREEPSGPAGLRQPGRAGLRRSLSEGLTRRQGPPESTSRRNGPTSARRRFPRFVPQDSEPPRSQDESSRNRPGRSVSTAERFRSAESAESPPTPLPGRRIESETVEGE